MILMMRRLFLIALITFVLGELDSDEAWIEFKAKYKRQYKNEEDEEARRFIWTENVKSIAKHNLEANLGFHTFWMGINKYSDWTKEEWNKHRRCLSRDNKYFKGPIAIMELSKFYSPPSVDWRNKSYVTEVKNQQDCGSCWAFSSTGSLEGQHKAKTGQLISLSEQNLVDCSRKEGNEGCDGGLMTSSFLYVKKNRGIATEDSYPYIAADDFCHFKNATVGATCAGFVSLPPGKESNLQSAVATIGPISVAICVTGKFMHYTHGVFYDPSCDTEDLDHAVLVVGYGTSNGTDYWIVKNSWGKEWGDNGYILMSRNKQNNCGIATLASYPLM